MRFSRPALAALGSAAALLFAACSGDEGGSSDTLDRAFSRPVPSADVTFDLRASVRGKPELEDPMRLRATGPYVRAEDGGLPSVDWEVTADGRGMGVTAGLVSTGENVWVEWLGTAYEVGPERVAKIEREHARRHEGGGLAELGIDPRRWVVDVADEGTEDVAGVETRHVSASLDVARFLEDMDRVAEHMGPPGEGKRLTAEKRRLIVEAVDAARFDVWAGTEDGVIRRLTAELEFDVPDEARERADGVESGEVSLLVELADVGGDQAARIRAPASARPIEELLDEFERGGGPMRPGALGRAS